MPYPIKGEQRNTGRTQFKEGCIPWNKGVKTGANYWLGKKRPELSGENNPMWKPKIEKKCINCNIVYFRIPSQANGSKYCSRSCRTKYLLSGEKHWNFKNWKTEESKRVRTSAKYYKWRKSVFERDNFTCQFCGERGGELNADHIKPFAIFKDLRFIINNGRTLCRKCHQKTDSWGSRANIMALNYSALSD